MSTTPRPQSLPLRSSATLDVAATLARDWCLRYPAGAARPSCHPAPFLLVHRLLLGPPADVDPILTEHLSARARAARQASRYPWDRLKRRLVWRSGEREHEAQLTGLNARGLRASLARWDVLALVNADTLERQGWAWDRVRGLWCRAERELDLGTPVRLRLEALIDEGPACELQAQLMDSNPQAPPRQP